jgi:CHASE3 domain sensor protein
MENYQENLDSLLLWIEDLRDQLEDKENLDKAEIYSTLRLIQRRAQATAETIDY